tara:strand:+ start:864 stop:1163 length:300 start_codon:yes stop_codon:yes gene_type:complete
MAALGGDTDAFAQLSNRLSSMCISDRLPVIERELETLREEFPSKRQFALSIKAKGLCLKDAQLYGKNLPRQLTLHKELRVSKNEAKRYPLVKECLVLMR